MIKIELKQRIFSTPDKIQQMLLAQENLERFFHAKFRIVQGEDEGEISGGKGSVRQVTIGKHQFKEEIISATKNHICYRIIGDEPVSNHQGDIYLKLINMNDLSKEVTELYYVIVCSGPKFVPDFIVKILVAKDIKRAIKKLAEYFDEY